MGRNSHDCFQHPESAINLGEYKMNLFTLTGLQLALQAKLEAQGFDAQTITDSLEGEGDELLEKRLGYVAIIKQKRLFGEARAKAAKDMEALSHAEFADIARMERALMESMIATGDTKIVGLQFEARVWKNQPSVAFSDVHSLPAEYWKTAEPTPPVSTPDKNAIKNAIKSGVEVAGAYLKQSNRLDIK